MKSWIIISLVTAVILVQMNRRLAAAVIEDELCVENSQSCDGHTPAGLSGCEGRPVQVYTTDPQLCEHKDCVICSKQDAVVDAKICIKDYATGSTLRKCTLGGGADISCGVQMMSTCIKKVGITEDYCKCDRPVVIPTNTPECKFKQCTADVKA